MRVYAYSEFSFKNDKLYLGNKNTKYSIKPCEVENTETVFYQIRFPDGSLSDDYYNRDRVKDNLIKMVQRYYNNDTKDDTQIAL